MAQRLVVLALVAFLAPAARAADTTPAERWQFFSEEAQIGSELLDLALTNRPESIALRNVRVLDVESGELRAGMIVLVAGGRIEAVGAEAATPVPKGARVIDAGNRVLVPGFVDMHVHNLESWSQMLLNLAAGVTTVRDMDGFPWLLALRDAIRAGRILAPNEYVSGQLLNFFPMDWYARVVRTPQEARTAVDEQARDGYDFIKVHNMMPAGMYRALADEAHKRGLDLVGHIPHDVLVADAVRAGQRTLEHLKGFYLDAGLKPSPEDWLSVMRGAHDVYVDPTFYVTRNSFREAEAIRLLDGEEMQFVPWRLRAQWRALAERPADGNLKLQRNVLPMSIEMSRRLHEIGTPFLTGTDSGGGYPFHVPGFALHEEFRYFQQAGFSALETLRAATLNAARAMRRESEFGTISPGKRADLVLLAGDPSQDLANADRIEGVMVRGVWLDRKLLDGMLADLRRLYAKPAAPLAPDAEAWRRLVSRYRDLRKRGLPLRDHDLAELCRLLDEEGEPALSDEVASWRTTRSPT
ncbi:MAG TPA: amidohydrolase family protein [Thermoanaerobaculia bacterium]|nr:amidohydrolase family protein [Thermoanaerobaculia bacterium]